MNKTWLSDWLLNIQDVFEHASPSILSMLAVFLPYLTPLPIASLTASSAKDFLGMTPTVAFIFVFVLEGIGLWTTVIFVDSIVQLINSRNAKTIIMVIALFIVICVYITILINLNVSLEEAVKVVNPVYSRVIMLICFLPLISGFMSGYYKVQLEHKYKVELSEKEKKELEEKRHQEAREDKYRNKLLKRGMVPSGNPTYSADTVSVQKRVATKQLPTSNDWRVIDKILTPEQRNDIATLTPAQTAIEWNITERTALNWKGSARKRLGMS